MLSVLMLNVVMVSVFMLNVVMVSVFAECCYGECLYAEFCYAECRYTECHYAECHGAPSTFMFLPCLLGQSYNNKIYTRYNVLEPMQAQGYAGAACVFVAIIRQCKRSLSL
jgi:hypothetical protein